MRDYTLPRRERERRRVRGLRPYTVLLCPFNGHQVTWCKRMCEPVDGHGVCGRVAPHAMKSRIQRAIEDYQQRQAGADDVTSSAEQSAAE